MYLCLCTGYAIMEEITAAAHQWRDRKQRLHWNELIITHILVHLRSVPSLHISQITHIENK